MAVIHMNSGGLRADRTEAHRGGDHLVTFGGSDAVLAAKVVRRRHYGSAHFHCSVSTTALVPLGQVAPGPKSRKLRCSAVTAGRTVPAMPLQATKVRPRAVEGRVRFVLAEPHAALPPFSLGHPTPRHLQFEGCL